MTLHIHAPQPTEKSIRAGHCPDCKRRSWFIGIFTPWYGWDKTCLRCGRHWQDGEWVPLAFVRQARQKSIDRAKRRFRAVVVQEAGR